MPRVPKIVGRKPVRDELWKTIGKILQHVPPDVTWSLRKLDSMDRGNRRRRMRQGMNSRLRKAWREKDGV